MYNSRIEAKMEYTVFLTQQPDRRWRATIPDLPNCVVEAATRSEALVNIQRLAVAVFKRSEVVRLQIPMDVDGQPIGFGAFQDDPTLASLFDEIERQRDSHVVGE